MSFGIQVFNASGNQLVDVADSVMTILGTFTVTYSTAVSAPKTGSFTNAEFARGTPFAIVAKYPQQTTVDPFPAYLKITFAGNVCTWRIDDTLTWEGFSPIDTMIGTLTFFYGYF